ncbi:MAG: M28 family peptidase [Opitutales bacterium]
MSPLQHAAPLFHRRVPSICNVLRYIVPVLGLLAGPAAVRAQPVQRVQDAIVADALQDRSAYEFLGRLCDDFGGRLTGSPANQAALVRTVEELRALGVDARLQTFKMPGWVRRDDEATLVVPFERRLRVCAIGYVQPHDAVEAAVVDLGNGSDEAIKGLDTKGKIGLLGPNAESRRGGYDALAHDLGLVGILGTCRVRGGQLLCRTGSFQGHPVNVPAFCVTQEEGLWMQRLLKRGRPVRVRLQTRSFCQEVDTANIVVTFPGRTAETVVVGAHFDSWDLGQGAIDNGLGTAQIFALAKLFQAHAPQNLRTVELVWFNGEEQGLWGSRHFAPTLQGRPVVAMVNLDMVGYPTSVNALGCAEMVPVLEKFNATLGARKLAEGVANADWFGSDQTSFQLQGIRAITVGGTIDPDVVRYYHDFGDSYDKSDPKMIAESSATIAALAYWLANEPGLNPHRMPEAETVAVLRAAKMEHSLRAVGLWPFKDEPAAPPPNPPAPKS